MKKYFLAGLLISSGAFAGKPLIVKTNTTGFVPIEHRRTEVCEVHEKAVVIKKFYGTGIETVRKIKAEIKGNVKGLIQTAAFEKVEESGNYLCDGPSTSVVANLGDHAVTLYLTGGCGTPKQQRSGFASSILMEIVNSYCPKTH